MTDVRRHLLEPLHDRLVVQPDPKAAPFVKGILWQPNPKTQDGTPQEGTVIAVGPGRYENGALIPVTLKAGDRIVHPQYSGTRCTIDGVELIVLRELDVLAKVHREGTEGEPARA